jgi:hypothetical protein
MVLARALRSGKHWQRRLAFSMVSLLAAGLVVRAMIPAGQAPAALVTVGHIGMFPVGSVTHVELPTTFYDPMRRYDEQPAPLAIDQGSPAHLVMYLRTTLTRILPIPIGRVAPVPIFLVHDPKVGLLALYNRDPFRGCRAVWMGITRRFVDPCHGSEYTQTGKHLRGPAPRDLDRFTIVVTANGDVLVDVSSYQLGSSE